jgi:hypothetical protein
MPKVLIALLFSPLGNGDVINLILHLSHPRMLLLVAVMLAAASVSVRHVVIVLMKQQGFTKKRSALYGNLMGVATMVFSCPWSLAYFISIDS